MIPGLNTNIERGDRRWHIQTEAAPSQPTMFTTQVFYEGAVVKTTHVPAPPGATLGALLKAQRRAHAEVVNWVETKAMDA